MSVTPIAFSQAETLTEKYNINISDDQTFDGTNKLYQLFNNYFADQLGMESPYASSNDLFNARGVDPHTDWTTSQSQVTGAFKVADCGHQFSILDSNENSLGSILDIGGSIHLHAGNEIFDLTGNSIRDIPDGLHVHFQLDVYSPSNNTSPLFNWSSDPDANGRYQPIGSFGDEMIHMLAINITDLYNAKYNTFFDTVYMFCWEDLSKDGSTGTLKADWDYQDFVAIMTNVKPVPEPSTTLVFLLSGGGVCAWAAWRRRKRG